MILLTQIGGSNMRKNLIYTLGTVATIAAPVAMVVSCGDETTQAAQVQE